jgi:hypothetical protein
MFLKTSSANFGFCDATWGVATPPTHKTAIAAAAGISHVDRRFIWCLPFGFLLGHGFKPAAAEEGQALFENLTVFICTG